MFAIGRDLRCLQGRDLHLCRNHPCDSEILVILRLQVGKWLWISQAWSGHPEAGSLRPAPNFSEPTNSRVTQASEGEDFPGVRAGCGV